jgi:hypothetical protein
MQLPLSSVDGMRVVNDRVYIAASATGRVLEYDLEGHLVKWLQMPKRPISLTAQDDRLVVRYSVGERILETGLLEGLRPPSTVRLEHTWWGHPWMVIGEGQQQRSFSLQPWYLTLLQLPWPGGLYGPLFILALLWASIAWSKERGRDRAEPTPFRSR